MALPRPRAPQHAPSLEPAPQEFRPAPSVPQLPDPTVGNEVMGVDPLMISSLPSIASGADVYARQFYRPSKIPSRRYLPVVYQ